MWATSGPCKGRRARKRRRSDEGAGASVVGVALLVATSLTVAAAPLVYLKMSAEVGQPVISGTKAAVVAGPGGWGDGDEVIEISHKGGQALRADEVEVIIRVNGVVTVVAGTDGSADGTLFAGPGTPWRHAMAVPQGAEVEVEVRWQRLMSDQLVSNEILQAPTVAQSGPADAAGGGEGGGGAGGGASADNDPGSNDDTPAQPVTVCHIPPGNPDAAHNLSIDPSALSAHLGHGDHEGPCDGSEGGGSGGDGSDEDNGNEGSGDGGSESQEEHDEGAEDPGADDDQDGEQTEEEDDDAGFTLCHVPPGNPIAEHTITVGAGAVAAHLAHGDHLGPCP